MNLAEINIKQTPWVLFSMSQAFLQTLVYLATFLHGFFFVVNKNNAMHTGPDLDVVKET